jgi:hypothetical protein
MNKCYTYILLIAIILQLTLVSALDYPTHKQSTNLVFSVTSNNATACNLTTINSPGTIISINQVGTKTSQTFTFNISSGNYTEFGTYCHNIECTDGSTVESGSECYEINYFGKELTQSQATIYLGLLGILILTLAIIFFGMRYLPASNERDDDGRILSINYLKYFRLVLWLFSYFLFIGILYLASNSAFAFLTEQLFAKLLFALFTIFLAISPIIIILIMVSFFVRFFHDKEFQRMLNRGIFPGGNL